MDAGGRLAAPGGPGGDGQLLLALPRPQLASEVRDSGTGFSVESANKAVTPFFSTRNVGLGLGLTVTRKIIEDHKGHVEIGTQEKEAEGVVRINNQTQRVPVDRQSLQRLAESTKGLFYEAATAEELKQVYKDMGSSIGYRTKPREVTQWYVGTALLFALAAAGLSLLWTSRLP